MKVVNKHGVAREIDLDAMDPVVRGVIEAQIRNGELQVVKRPPKKAAEQ